MSSGRIDIAELPAALAEHVSPRARLTYPNQGMTSDVAFAEHEGCIVAVKRCAHAVYIDWLRREHVVLRALGSTGLPVPRLIGYAEAEADGALVGWLVMSRLPGSPLLSAARNASPSTRETMFLRLGELLRRLHTTRVPPELAEAGSWLSRRLDQAHEHLSWCEGDAAGLAELERSCPAAVTEALIHGDLALDNVLVDEEGALSIIDWPDGGPGDPRYDIALALNTEPELDPSVVEVDAFYAGYGTAALDDTTRRWFVRLYEYF